MRLGAVRVTGGAQRIAVAVGDAAERAVVLDTDAPLASPIESWDTVRAGVEREVAAKAADAVPASTLDWLPPVPRPGKVICVALNNSANVDRIMSGPDKPATFNKAATSLLGHGQPIRLKKEFGRVHPEPELAVVIGGGGADIPLSAAMGHVFGYTFSAGGGAVQNVNLTELGGPIEVTISGIGTLSNPVETR
jgi:2-keto-4-pentenoate hydratase/2-oxohepta-3-ene-1,7-dioic acid hydratase in catechol pathway